MSGDRLAMRTDEREFSVTQQMRMSEQGIELLQSIETLATEPYDDQTGEKIDHWVKGATIGYGHLILQDQWELYRGGITEAQAGALFEKDLQPFIEAVNQSLMVPQTQNQFDALVILVFNIGAANFRQSSVLKLINDPSAETPYHGLEQAWKAWNKSQGKVNEGLNNRRQAEWKIYTEGVYETW
jgi:type VI secretion system secreted protein VgrG